MNKELINKIARAIYESGFEEYRIATAKEPRIWEIEHQPWDTLTDKQLCEWERDEYRTMARAALKLMQAEIERLEGELATLEANALKRMEELQP
jgi:hypothetical protein